MTPRLLAAASLLFLANLCWAEVSWVPLTVPRAEESEALSKLQDKGIEVLGWSNAVVDVSSFDGIELVPVSELQTRLTPQDPRWDPWLKEVTTWFHSGPGSSVLWVSAAGASAAQGLVGASPQSSAERAGPRRITGWALVALTTLYVIFVLISGFHTGWPSWKAYRRWTWVPVSAALLILGIVLTSGRTAVAAPKAAAVSWLQHRWFQESWPWGAEWKNYQPGKAWLYRSYERHDGKVSEVDSSLVPADESWVRSLREGMDPRLAARIFASDIP